MKVKFKLLNEKEYIKAYGIGLENANQLSLVYNEYILAYKKCHNIMFNVKYDEKSNRYDVINEIQIYEYGVLFFYPVEVITERQIKLRLLKNV
jgi:capsule polysaccharide modification protein KpsS